MALAGLLGHRQEARRAPRQLVGPPSASTRCTPEKATKATVATRWAPSSGWTPRCGRSARGTRAERSPVRESTVGTACSGGGRSVRRRSRPPLPPAASQDGSSRAAACSSTATSPADAAASSATIASTTGPTASSWRWRPPTSSRSTGPEAIAAVIRRTIGPALVCRRPVASRARCISSAAAAPRVAWPSPAKTMRRASPPNAITSPPRARARPISSVNTAVRACETSSAPIRPRCASRSDRRVNPDTSAISSVASTLTWVTSGVARSHAAAVRAT